MEAAVAAWVAWDPDREEEPQGWERAISMDKPIRRRPGGDASKEYLSD